MGEQAEHECIPGFAFELEALAKDSFALRADFFGHALAGAIAHGHHDFEAVQTEFLKSKLRQRRVSFRQEWWCH